MKTGHYRRSAFTLVEVIVTLVLFSLVMAAVLPFLGKVFARSYEPRMQLHQSLGLQSAMEDVITCQTNRLAELKQLIGSEGGTWRGEYTVEENRYVHFISAQEAGSPATNSLLKVTLRNTLGERVTRLFAEPL
jgi:prepilin-type N-terminal cleavage/methylation domain-containing protein